MSQRDTAFIQTVRAFYNRNGRHSLPWRKTTKPYNILVSEIMLQQTQVERVVPKYQAFIKQFPTTKQMAEASLAEVLTQWQGLGYNRRAKLLWQCAQVIHHQKAGRWPKTYNELIALPGIGPYTAGAVLAFAYNEAVPLIETNVRTVYLHHFFPKQTDVTDAAMLRLITKHLTLLPTFKVFPRTWYAALMDYGSHLKRTHGNPNNRAKNYVKQSRFRGSDREVRGAIIRALSEKPATEATLKTQLKYLNEVKIDAQLDRLLEEGMIQKTKLTYRLPD